MLELAPVTPSTISAVSLLTVQGPISIFISWAVSGNQSPPNSCWSTLRRVLRTLEIGPSSSCRPFPPWWTPHPPLSPSAWCHPRSSRTRCSSSVQSWGGATRLSLALLSNSPPGSPPLAASRQRGSVWRQHKKGYIMYVHTMVSRWRGRKTILKKRLGLSLDHYSIYSVHCRHS